MIEVLAYEPTFQNRWNQFVETAKNGHFMFDRGYMDYHQDRFPDRSLVFLKNDKVVALLPAHGPTGDEGDTGAVVSHGGLSFGGIISGRAMNVRMMLDVVDALLAFMGENGWSHLSYRAIPHIYHAYPAEEDLFALIERGAARINTKVGCALRIGSPPGYNKSRRHLLGSAKKQLDVEISETHDLDGFYDLLCESLQRRHGATPVHSREELRFLVERFPGNMKTFGALWKGELLAALMVFESPTCYRLQYKASNERGFAMHASDLIEDFLIRDYGQPGRWLDFGTSMLPGSEALDKTLIQYKESFGARALLQNTYRLEAGR